MLRDIELQFFSAVLDLTVSARAIPTARFASFCGAFKRRLDAERQLWLTVGAVWYFPTHRRYAYSRNMKRDAELIALLFYTLVVGAIAHGLLRGLMTL